MRELIGLFPVFQPCTNSNPTTTIKQLSARFLFGQLTPPGVYIVMGKKIAELLLL